MEKQGFVRFNYDLSFATMQERKVIEIGCGEWGFRNLPMREHFEIARDFDFKWLEFGIGGDQTGRLSEFPEPDEIAEFKALNEEFGIATPFCCIENDFTLADENDHLEVLEKSKKQIQAAADCGAKQVRLFAGFTPVEKVSSEIWDRMIKAFWDADQLCEGLGLTIAIETHGGITFDEDESAHHFNSVSTDPESLTRLMEQLPPRVGFNYDPGNIKAVRPEDTGCCLELINDRINYCHLKDWTRKGEGWVAVAIGDDDLDYGPLFENMKYDGVCLIEYEPLHDSREGIRRSLDYLQRIEEGSQVLKFQR